MYPPLCCPGTRIIRHSNVFVRGGEVSYLHDLGVDAWVWDTIMHVLGGKAANSGHSPGQTTSRCPLEAQCACTDGLATQRLEEDGPRGSVLMLLVPALTGYHVHAS